ncbi:hypothetical protein B0H17DRAFT_1180624 [Mycena rosella]|uniref:CCHC-type domain-containing protein n=1 Tax=Mycena rosella TaxID=1033263 RepID=A0AAD7GHJ4_MYCRO|nr:hypothetical protein B0H17DRAFT_1180624 [Mycena rosella]
MYPTPSMTPAISWTTQRKKPTPTSPAIRRMISRRPSDTPISTISTCPPSWRATSTEAPACRPAPGGFVGPNRPVAHHPPLPPLSSLSLPTPTFQHSLRTPLLQHGAHTPLFVPWTPERDLQKVRVPATTLCITGADPAVFPGMPRREPTPPFLPGMRDPMPNLQGVTGYIHHFTLLPLPPPRTSIQELKTTHSVITLSIYWMSHNTTPGWDNTPHLGVADSQPFTGPSGPDTTLSGTSAFLSAKTTASVHAGDTSSVSSGDHTTSNDQPSGLSVTVKMDSSGRHYVMHPDTGLRFDIVDDTSIPTETPYYASPGFPGIFPSTEARVGASASMSRSPSSTSDMQLTASGSVMPGEKVLDNLLHDIGVELTAEQQLRYSSIRGMLSTGQSTLLSTIAFLAEQHSALNINVRTIEVVPADTESKLLAIHNRVTLQEDRVDQCLEESIKALRTFGSTEAQLEQLTLSMASYNARSSRRAGIGITLPSCTASRSSTPLEELRPKLDSALPPKNPNESDEAYHRRAMGNVHRKERTATVFQVPITPIDAPTPSAVRFAEKTAHFEDVGSISPAPFCPFVRYGSEPASAAPPGSAFSYARSAHLPVGSHFESFHSDKESIIRKIVAREVGEPLSLPPHIKPPKVDAPAKYSGVDDLDAFMKFIEMICTWIRSQMLCGYEPAIDNFRLTMLKTHLSGDALDWFIETRMTFTDALCAMHQRFVTTSNAERATVAFDAVRYNDTTGPEGFAEALIKRANQMAHVPGEFVVNQRFLAGLPQTIRYKLRVNWQMTAEYTPLTPCEPTRANSGKYCPKNPPRKLRWPHPVQQLTAPTMPLARCMVPPAPNPQSTRSEDSRTCFKCGGLGHIASNPKCPRFHEPMPLRLGAQRVIESYADEAEASGDAMAAVEGRNGEDEYKGLWGGAHYDPDYEDSNQAPDLDELLDMAEVDRAQGTETRMGTMRAQYFALRIAEPEEEVAAEAPTAANTATSSAIFDATRLQMHVPSNDSRYTEWTAAAEAQLDAEAAALLPDILSATFDSLLSDFEAHIGEQALSASDSLELKAIYALGAEEAARNNWRGMIPIQPQVLVGYTPAVLRTNAVDLIGQPQSFTRRIEEMRIFQQDLVGLLSRRLEARDELSRLLCLPASSASPTSSILRQAEDYNLATCSAIDRHVRQIEHNLEQMTASLHLFEDELTRRMLAREVFALASLLRSNSPPELSGGPDRPDHETVGNDDRTNSALPFSSSNPQVEETHTTEEADSPPSDGSTPPPSYPGTPESSGAEGLWDRVSDIDAVVNSVPSLPGDMRVVVINSDSEDDSSMDDSSLNVQVLTQSVLPSKTVERLSNVHRPGMVNTVGLLDQPRRVKSNMACLAAMLSVGESQAYMLFDSGSNTDSITPEYAKVSGLSPIRLEEQITLQLGCISSRSKISFGARAPIDFGGIKAGVYGDMIYH